MELIFQGIQMSVFEAKQPIPETNVRIGPACAGAVEKPRAIRAAAMVGNISILIVVCAPSNAGA
jgi:hypothetical protein